MTATPSRRGSSFRQVVGKAQPKIPDGREVFSQGKWTNPGTLLHYDMHYSSAIAYDTFGISFFLFCVIFSQNNLACVFCCSSHIVNAYADSFSRRNHDDRAVVLDLKSLTLLAKH